MKAIITAVKVAAEQELEAAAEAYPFEKLGREERFDRGPQKAKEHGRVNHQNQAQTLRIVLLEAIP